MRGSHSQKSVSSPRKPSFPNANSERNLKKTGPALKANPFSRAGKQAANPIPRSLADQSLRSPGRLPQPPISSRKLSVLFPMPDGTKLPLIRSRAGSDAVVVSPRMREVLRHDFLVGASQKDEKRLHFSESQVGSILSRAKPNNQDSSFYVENTAPPFTVVGVCDGHGHHGHFVSAYLSTRLPELLRAHALIAHTTVNWTQTLMEVCHQVNADLRVQQFDTMCSGTTCVCVVVADGKVYCGNVGDSRAVLGRKKGNCIDAVPLSRDHKPDVPDELRRIVECGGRVDPVFKPTGEPLGPSCVWFQNEDFPGLAMSRVFGDGLAARIGVIAVPGIYHAEVIVIDLMQEDQFLILASDGVWEFISSQEAVTIVDEYWSTGKEAACCKALVEVATKRWRQEEGSIDDITVAVIGIGS